MSEETILNKKKRIIDRCYKKARKKSYSCFFPGCLKKAISSHSQSKSSSLKNIQENGLVVIKDFFAFPKNPIPNWEEISLIKVSTFPGFCSTHDDALFKKVDSINDINISSNALASVAFRTFAMEMRKKEYFADMIDSIMNNVIENIGGELTDLSENPIDGFKNCLKVTKPFYLNFFNKFLASAIEPQMAHKIFRFGKNLNVSCSTIINPIPMFQHPIDKPQPLISFNILPRKAYTLIIFSCADHDLALMNDFINDNERLEDLVFNFCEEIAINPTFFRKIPPRIIAAIDHTLRPWDIWEKGTIPDLFNVKLSNDSVWKLTNEK